ncbi:uncharacterized protein LOC124913279 [Impatiens glandulifera]|uniref:uncharacterized protein LOC124913279 n=1 Tax=Impatiens glandulifera TaxID=253017 RepID=UPI001FB188F0|nr:uncharacterized protein LOC124913279 [Impatiens glandulifera]
MILTFHIWKSLASSTNDCILNIQFPSQRNDSNCVQGNWGGFLEANCCVVPFDGYLHALGERANKTGQIFLNMTEQVNCLASMKTKQDDVLNCGIQKLTSGEGGCSDYSVIDVINKLENFENMLEESCDLGSDDLSGEACGSCLRMWEEMGEKGEDDICRFAVLVTVTSRGIYEEKWIKELYGCLQGQNRLSMGNGIHTF